jgi:large subunit ribosomal protein L18
MARYKTKAEKRQVRRYRIRKKVVGGAVRPRISVYRSLNHIYAQLIDDASGKTLAQANDKLDEVKAKMGDGKGKVGRAKAVGILLAERAKAIGIQAAAFDRGGYLYHGRVKALAEGAREGGLEF